MATTTNIVTTWYPESGKEGVDLNSPQTIPATATDIPAPRAKLGDVVLGNNGSVWVFVQASTTVTANNLVAIDVNFACNDLTATLAASLKYGIGMALFSQATVANAADYFWACLKALGGAALNFVGTAASGSQLYVSSTQPGGITSAVSANRVIGLYANSTITGATTTTDVVALTYLYATTSV